MRQAMNKHIKIAIIISLLCCGIGKLHSYSQTLDIGFFGGGSYYLGDINPDQHFVGSQLAYGALARLNTSDRFSLRLGFTRGKLQADDMDFRDKDKLPVPAFSLSNPITNRENYISRGLNFTTYVNELSLQAEINFLEFFVGSKRHRWSPFIFGGTSIFFFNPKEIHTGTKLKDLGTEGQNLSENNKKSYSTTALAIPFGIGVKLSLSKRLGMSIEWGMRKTFTDYIDDISTTYAYDILGFNVENNVYYAPNPDAPGEIIACPITEDILLADPTLSHTKGQQRGNDYNTDWYNFFGITLTYSIDLEKDKGCRNFNKRH